MDLSERDYRFTDDQVRALGFSSYEELEKYYDLMYMNMGDQSWTKEQCVREVLASGSLERLNYSRYDRLKSSLSDRMDVIICWNETDCQPSVEEVISEQEALNRILRVYLNFCEREARLSEAKSQTPAVPKFSGRL